MDVRPHVECVRGVVGENTPLPLPPADAYGLPMSGYVLREGVVKAGATVSYTPLTLPTRELV